MPQRDNSNNKSVLSAAGFDSSVCTCSFVGVCLLADGAVRMLWQL
jgi:hypothetical protein